MTKTTLNLNNIEDLDRYIAGLERIVEVLDNANVQLPLPFESPDGSVAEDVGGAADDVSTSGLRIDDKAIDRATTKFQAAFGPGTLATPELNRALALQCCRMAALHIEVEELAASIETEGKGLLAVYLGVPNAA